MREERQLQGRFQRGDRIGPYVVVEFVAAGGQGEVYKAYQLGESSGPRHYVALKVLATPLLHDARARSRFEEESETLARLVHSNIVRLVQADMNNDPPFIAQEYVEGESLASLLRRKAPLEITQVLRFAAQIASAISYAHEADLYVRSGGRLEVRAGEGVAHGDLSTDNVMVAENERIRLIDFGLARILEATTVSETVTGTTGFAGRYFYAAPELLGGGRSRPTPATDVYAFGVCLYEMIAMGRPITERLDVLEDLRQHAGHLATALPAGVPQDVCQLIEACVQREVRDRPTMKEVRECLERLLTVTPPQSPELPPGLRILSPLMLYDRKLDLQSLGIVQEEKCDIGFSWNQEGSRLILLLQGTRVVTLDGHGGHVQVSHVPASHRLAAIAGLTGREALGLEDTRGTIAHMEESGNWLFTPLGTAQRMGGPHHCPDSILACGDSFLVGDYETNQVRRFRQKDGTHVSATPEAQLTQLGPFTAGGNHLFCLDMRRLAICAAPLERLPEMRHLVDLGEAGFPTALAVSRDFLLVLDPQRRSLDLYGNDGSRLLTDVLAWDSRMDIQQLALRSSDSELALLDLRSSCLHFLRLAFPEREMCDLSLNLGQLGIQIPSYAYESVERSVQDFLQDVDYPEREARAEQVMGMLRRKGIPGRRTNWLKIAVCRLVARTHPDRLGRLDWMLKAVQDADLVSGVADIDTHSAPNPQDLLGRADRELAKSVYEERVRQVDGFDAEVREKLGTILEYEKDWQRIVELDAEFLCSEKVQKTDWCERLRRSFERTRVAYHELGIEPPDNIQPKPMDCLLVALGILDSGRYEETRKMLSGMYRREEYVRLDYLWARVMLAALASSIKMSMRIRPKDWREVEACLTTLVEKYPDPPDATQVQAMPPRIRKKFCQSREQYQRDRIVAQRKSQEDSM